MITSVMGRAGVVVLTGIGGADWRSDGQDGDVNYRLVLQADEAGVFADGIGQRHHTLRLFHAWGVVGPVDGETLIVMEVGTHWHAGAPSIVARVAPSDSDCSGSEPQVHLETVSLDACRAIAAAVTDAAEGA